MIEKDYPSLWGSAFFSAVVLICLTTLGLGSLSPRAEVTREKSTDTTNERSQLQISARTDKTIYKQNEVLKLEASVRNVSTKPIYVYGLLGWSDLGSFEFHAYGSDGKEIMPNIFADSMSGVPRDRTDFVKLEYNHFLGAVFNIPLQYLNLNRPGKYTIVVEYHGPLPKEFGLGLDIWPREKGSLYAEPVEIEVMPPE